MKTIFAPILAAILLPTVGAQISGHGTSSTQDCGQETLLGLLGVTSAGNIEECIYYSQTVQNAASGFTITIHLTAPAATGAGAATYTPTWTAVSGCTLNGASVTGGPGGTGFGTEFWSYQAYTMTSQQCNWRVQAVYANGAGTTLYNQPFNGNTIATDTFTRTQTYGCSSTLTACNIAQVAICNASDAAATNTCKDPDIRMFVCGESIADPLQAASCITPSVRSYFCDASTISTQPIPVSECMHPGMFNFLCNAKVSADADACETLRVATYGCGADTVSNILAHVCSNPTMNIAITSMPTLNVANTGTSTVTIASWPSLSASVGITSIPSLNIASMPTITVNDQVHILDSVALHAILDGQAHLVLDSGTLKICGQTGTCGSLQVNSTSTIAVRGPINETINIPGNINVKTTLCGPATMTNACPPTQTQSTLFIGQNGLLEILIVAALGAWLWAASRLIPVRLLGIVVEFYAGFMAIQRTPQPFGGNTLGLALWLLASIFFLHMAISRLWAIIQKRKQNPDTLEAPE